MTTKTSKQSMAAYVLKQGDNSVFGENTKKNYYSN